MTTLTFDRRVSDSFLALFDRTSEQGAASSLVDYANRALFPVDLRFRKDARSGQERATLYVGLTSVLDLAQGKKGKIRLDVHPTHRKAGGFDAAWRKPMSVEDLANVWPDVELYLERVIPLAAQSHGRTEGAVQAAMASATSGRYVVDREYTPSFPDKKSKRAFLDQRQAPILEALDDSPLDFAGRPRSLGNECDAVAIDSCGRVLAVEVKPLSGGTIAWVAAQAVMYARILQAWVDQPAEDGHGAGEILEGMVAQRRQIGLAGDAPQLSQPIEVVPVVAVQRGASAEMVRRMLAVRDSLASHDLGAPPVEIYEVNLLGELIPLNESRLPDGRPRARGWYRRSENARQVAWKHAPSSPLPKAARAPGTVSGRDGRKVEVDYALPSAHAKHNLLPEVRDQAVDLFGDLGIPWHQGSDGMPSPHLRSSQVQCVNALGQMVSDPHRVKAAFGALLDVGEVCDFGEVDPAEAGRFLTFEYIGPKDYFGESRNGSRTRGSHCTSVDAAFAYATSEGVRELALVEWKYTEHYPSAVAGAESKREERLRRYGLALNDPDGPIAIAGVDPGDLFHEPLYQLVRQQLLAHAIEVDPSVPVDRVRVVHVLSPDNSAYTSSFVAPELRHLGTDVKSVWRTLLKWPDRFHALDPTTFLDPAVTSDNYRHRYGAVDEG